MSTLILEPPALQPLSYEEERGKPIPSQNHAFVQTNLILQFAEVPTLRAASELTLEIGDKRFTPDISLLPRTEADFDHDIIARREPPLTVVEIPSPTQGMQEVMDKLDAYFGHGIRSVWIVSPHLRTITIVTADRRRRTYDSGVATDPATGVSAKVDQVFA